MFPKQTVIPSLVRIKPDALDRVGIYAERHGFRRVAVFFSGDLRADYLERLENSLRSHGVTETQATAVNSAAFEEAVGHFERLPAGVEAIIGLGGGKALDVAKYVGFLSRFPYLAVSTSLSNDGICSAQSSLTLAGRRKSFPSAMPAGVVIDTTVCLAAPKILWLSGIGDLVAKFTAVVDWKLAFHANGTAVDDFAALLSDASVYQFLGRPIHDADGVRLLGTALLLNGIAMGICGSSRPASGSEHLISHALDGLSPRPRLHGLQVGVATYLMSLLQGQNSKSIADLFEVTGFWDAIHADPFSRTEWLDAVRLAPAVKADFYTILSARDCGPEIEEAMRVDPFLSRSFV